jgi:hypothetical protein
MSSVFTHASPHIPDNQVGFVAKKNNTKRLYFQSGNILGSLLPIQSFFLAANTHFA